MRIDRTELSSRQRRKISRMVRRMISRETDGIECLVNELRQSIAEIRGNDLTRGRIQHFCLSSGEDGNGRLHKGHLTRTNDDDHLW